MAQHIGEYCDMHGKKRDTVLYAIHRGKLKAYKWQNIWWICADNEELPPAKIITYLPPKRTQTTLSRLERRVEELEVVIKELQGVLKARGYKLLKPIVGRLPGEDRRDHETSKHGRRSDKRWDRAIEAAVEDNAGGGS